MAISTEKLNFLMVVVVQSFSCVQLFATPWTGALQASLSFTISWSLLKPMSIESVMSSNPLILCCPLLLLPSIFPSIRVSSNESALRILAFYIVTYCLVKQIFSSDLSNKLLENAFYVTYQDSVVILVFRNQALNMWRDTLPAVMSPRTFQHFLAIYLKGHWKISV